MLNELINIKEPDLSRIRSICRGDVESVGSWSILAGYSKSSETVAALNHPVIMRRNIH